MLTSSSRVLSFMLLIFLSISTFAQTFTNRNDLLNKVDISSGAPIAVTDMNGDFLDDIIRLDGTVHLYFEYQQADGTFRLYDHGEVSNNAWAVCIADVNNDGICEMMTGGAYNGVAFLTPNPDGTYNNSSLDGPNLFVQGMNFADINNDGFLDAFSCHDDGTSHIWKNNGTGNLSFSGDELIDLAKYNGNENNSGNYGSVWTDFDSDGDLDLYIAKCRQGVNGTTDVRRINQLWVNDGTNNYTEAAADYGLDIGWQSWTAEFQDIDNDGDFDCFITNHDYQSQLLENVDNQFIDITASSGINITGLPIQAAMKDFDNDGFVDLLVSGNYYHNNGDKTFRRIVPNPFENGVHTFAIGDLNHDGFLDACIGYGDSFNSSGGQDDVLWINDGNENNFMAVNLVGNKSNRGGVGARIEINGDWGIMIREVRAGESYGIVHTLTQHFGLGVHETIESIIVKWPSGQIDVIENPEINQFLTIYENDCVPPTATIDTEGPTEICEGESVLLTAPEGFLYNWSTGQNTQTIEVTEAGYYNVAVENDEGCFGVSPAIQVTYIEEIDVTIAIDGNLTFCEGEQLTLTSSPSLEGYAWSNGASTQSIEVLEAGTYQVTIEGVCNAISSEEIMVETLATPSIPVSEDVTLLEASTTTLTATGNNPQWYDSEDATTPLATGTTFETPFIEESATFYVSDVNQFGGEEGTGGPEEHTGTSQFSGGSYNGQIIFDSYTAFTLKTVRVYTDTPGERIVELQDENGNVLESLSIDVPMGESVQTLNFPIPEGTNLRLTTNTALNNELYGFNSPRLRRTSSSGTVDYPYDVIGVATLKDSDNGMSFYYYFYDWNVQLPDYRCESERSSVTATVESTAVEDISVSGAIEVFPNPTSDQFTINIAQGNSYQYELIDLTGRVLSSALLDASSIQQVEKVKVNHLAKGMYWLRFMNEDKVYSTKIIVQ